MQSYKNQQFHLINKFKHYLNRYDKKFYEPEKNSIFYPASYAECIGSYILKKHSLQKLNFFHNCKIILKDTLYCLKYRKIDNIKIKNSFSYERLIITWAFKNNFKKDGSIDDRYFNINSKKTKNTLWFVIYQGEKKPLKIDKNIVLFNPLSNKINISNLFLLIIKNLRFITSINYFLSSISNYNYFSKIFIKNVSPYINNNLKTLILPYEGQPFQNKLIQLFKKKNLNIKTIGYIHSPPLALPSNFIYKNYSPQKIIVNGQDQLKCFSKILGWKKSDIIFEPSFRFVKKKTIKNKIIFLPLNIKNIDNVIKSLIFLNKKKIINLKDFEVRNHPASTKSKKNLIAEKEINKIINDLKKNKVYKKKEIDYSIFIGTSGSIIEALENGKNVIQITEDNIFDYYSEKIWKSIKSKKISKNIFIYKLKKKGQLIKLGNIKNNLKKITNL